MTKATKQLSELINSGNNNTKPSHNLVISVETESGIRVLGKVGLFTSNNPLHEVVSELSADDLNQLGSLLHFTVEQFSESSSKDKPKLAFKK